MSADNISGAISTCVGLLTVVSGYLVSQSTQKARESRQTRNHLEDAADYIHRVRHVAANAGVELPAYSEVSKDFDRWMTGNDTD